MSTFGWQAIHFQPGFLSKIQLPCQSEPTECWVPCKASLWQDRGS